MNTKRTKQKLLIPILICSVAASFYIYDYILRVMPEAMTHYLMIAFNLHAGKLGLLASLFFWGYAPMQIPVGMLFDRFSARLLLTVTLLLSSLATLGFAFTDSYMLAGVFRFIMGMMASFAFVGALVVGANWFRGQYFAFYTGLVQFLGCMGAILGIAPVVILTENYGWRHTTLLIAILGFILSILMWLVVRDAPKRKTKRPRKHLFKKSSHSYHAAFSNAQTWLVGLFGFAIWAPVTIFPVLWGVPYLRNVYHLSRIDAASKISIIWFTIALGGPLVGWFSKYIQRRRLPMIVCSILGIFSSWVIIHFADLSQTMLTVSLVFFGVGASGLVVAFGLVVDLHSPKTVGAVIGFTNMAVIFGGLVLQPAAGYIMQYLWQGKTSYGIPIYTHHTYSIALLMIPLSFLLALIASFLIKETCCVKQHRYE